MLRVPGSRRPKCSEIPSGTDEPENGNGLSESALAALGPNCQPLATRKEMPLGSSFLAIKYKRAATVYQVGRRFLPSRLSSARPERPKICQSPHTRAVARGEEERGGHLLSFACVVSVCVSSPTCAQCVLETPLFSHFNLCVWRGLTSSLASQVSGVASWITPPPWPER